jgi:hypothetical protein
MERGKDLSGLYLLIGALLGFFVAFALVQAVVRPQIAAHYGATPGAKPSLAQTHTETRVLIASTCAGAAIGMFGGCKAYSLRLRKRGAVGE